MDNSNLFLDSKAVAAILMVSKRTLQNYRSEGKLVFYKISPKTIRYRVEDVVDFLKQSNCCSYQKDRVKRAYRKIHGKIVIQIKVINNGDGKIAISIIFLDN